MQRCYKICKVWCITNSSMTLDFSIWALYHVSSRLYKVKFFLLPPTHMRAHAPKTSLAPCVFPKNASRFSDFRIRQGKKLATVSVFSESLHIWNLESEHPSWYCLCLKKLWSYGQDGEQKGSVGPYFVNFCISSYIIANQRDFWLIENLQQNLQITYQVWNFGLKPKL